MKCCNTANRSVTRRVQLPAEAYTILRSPQTGELFVSLWGGGKVLVLDAEAKGVTAEIPTGSYPNDLVLTRDGRYLFTSCGNENSVSVIDVGGRRVVDRRRAGPVDLGLVDVGLGHRRAWHGDRASTGLLEPRLLGERVLEPRLGLELRLRLRLAQQRRCLIL